MFEGFKLIPLLEVFRFSCCILEIYFIIDHEIHQFRQIDAGKKSEMLKALQQLPELPLDNNPQPVDPTDIPEATPHPLSGNELPAVSNLDPGFISNYCDPLINIQVEKPIIQTIKSDIDYLTFHEIHQICLLTNR